jgi:serine/threonine-protein kinase HipA
MSKKGNVYFGNELAGIILETDEGYEFVYDEKYLEANKNHPISLTLPLQKEKFTSKVLFSFFDGLIPEGWLLQVATDYWKVKSNDRFELLLLTCGDTIGAVTVVPENE